MVQHEYVLDETVSRRFVRRYHLNGAETILFFRPGAACDGYRIRRRADGREI